MNRSQLIKEKILATYEKLKTYETKLYNNVYLPDVYIDEFLMFVAIYDNYNFKGCPYLEINQVAKLIPEDLLKIDINFVPVYSIYLQDTFDLLFEWVFKYTVTSTKIKIIELNIKNYTNYLSFKVYNNYKIKDLIVEIAQFYNMSPKNLILKKNNTQLEPNKHLLEYKLDDSSNLSLYINQIGGNW